MDKVAQFLSQAEQCRTLADKAGSENMRLELLRLAQGWIRLASERETIVNSRFATDRHLYN